MSTHQDPLDVSRLQVQVSAFIRWFGLLQPERTPCGRPVAVSEAHALAELDRDGPMPQHELAARLRLEKSTVSRLVRHLQARGWVTGSHREGDGRLIWLELSAAGKGAASELASARRAKFEQIIERIPGEEREAAVGGLQILVKALGDLQ
jgi:DNA-binding MarR family transcriptional regulator